MTRFVSICLAALCTSFAGNAATIDNAPAVDDLNSVTLRLDLSTFDQEVNSVHIVGSFNLWDDIMTPMSDSNSDEIWEATVNFPIGEQLYRFVVNGDIEEGFDGTEPCTTAPGAVR